MSKRDGIDLKDLDDLIARLSRCQEEAPGDLIPVQDVKEILQQVGLLESILKEHPSSIKGAAEIVEQQGSPRKSSFKKRFFALAAAAIGFSWIMGYDFGADHAKSKAKLYANLTDVRKGNSNIGAAKVGDTVGSTRAYPPDFSLIYQGCKRSGTAVKCSVDVVARIARNYSMGDCTTDDPHRTKLLDSKGGVYKADIVKFSGEPGEYECLGIQLLEDVPVKATLTFKNVDPEIKMIKSLEIWIATSGEEGTRWNNPQFREVAIE
jgi:hypothetical protein